MQGELYHQLPQLCHSSSPKAKTPDKQGVMKPHSVTYKSTSKKSSEIVDSAPVNGVKLIQLFQCLQDEALLWAIQIGEPLKKISWLV